MKDFPPAFNELEERVKSLEQKVKKLEEEKGCSCNGQ